MPSNAELEHYPSGPIRIDPLIRFAILGTELLGVLMRYLAILAVFLMLATPVLAQKDKLPLTAKVISSDEETVPETGGVATVATSRKCAHSSRTYLQHTP